MKTHRSVLTHPRHSAGSAPPSQGLIRAWVRFWFMPEDRLGLNVLRLLAGLLFLAWLVPLAGQLDSFFGLHGWFDTRAYAEARSVDEGVIPRAGWTVLYWVGSNPTSLQYAYWLSVAVIGLFILGIAPRVAALLTWVIVVSFSWNPALYYDGDVYLRLLAFYLMLGYLLEGQANLKQPWATRLLGTQWMGVLGLLRRSQESAPPSLGANLAVRLLQVHFAIIMVVSGLHKLQFGDWWAGVALWFPLYPPFETTLAQARLHSGQAENYFWVLSIAAYAVLIWQIGFPLFAWRRSWRPILLAGGVIAWLGHAFIYQLPLIGPALLIGGLAFVTAEEWRLWLGLLARMPGLRWLGRAASDVPADGVSDDDSADAVPTRVRSSEARSEAITTRALGS